MILEKLRAEVEDCVLIGRRLRPLFDVAARQPRDGAVSLLSTGAHLYEFPAYPRGAERGVRLNTLYLALARADMPALRAQARLGPRGGALLDERLRSRGLGKFLLADLLKEGMGIEPKATLLDGWLTPADAEDARQRRRHRHFYRAQGIEIEHYGTDSEGRFFLDRLDEATPNFDARAVQDIGWQGLERELAQLYADIAPLACAVNAKRTHFRRTAGNDVLLTQRLPEPRAPRDIYTAQGAAALARHCYWVFSVLRTLWRSSKNLDAHLAEGKHIPWHRRLAGEIDSIKSGESDGDS
jgi:hypothetical protein